MLQRRTWRNAGLGTVSTNRTCGVSLAGEDLIFPFFCISAFHFGYFSGFSVGILENENYTVDSIITQLRPVMYLILMKPDRSGGVGDVLITASPNVLIADRPAHNGARGKEIGVGLVYNYHQNQSLSQWAPTARLILFPNSSWEWPTTNLVSS